MLELHGDIWKLAPGFYDTVVVPTNLGNKKDGRAIMGKGLAAQAARMFPSLAEDYGAVILAELTADTPPALLVPLRARTVHGHRKNLILFPTKPRDRERPWMSWQNAASLGMIERGLNELAGWWKEQIATRPAGTLFIPDLGCGNGGLPVEVVRPMILKAMQHLPRVAHVVRGRKKKG